MVASLGAGISFAVNGQKHNLDPGVQPCTTLYDYLRGRTTYTGTKSGCGEGGCGSCSVEIYQYNPASGKTTSKCINACLAPIASLDGCSIVSVEGLGNCFSGFNPVQDAIARYHGSQCGFCTPGMAVACHAALSKHEDKGSTPSAEQMEKALDGNLCRCTGYRPILDACKSFVKDVEDLGLHDSTTDRCRVSPRTGLSEDVKMPAWLKAYNKNKAAAGASKQVSGAGQTWAAPTTLTQLMDVLKALPSKEPGGEQLRIIAGNTGAGVFKNWPTSNASLVDVTKVEELRVLKQTEEGGLLIGAAVTQEEVIDKLLEFSSLDVGAASKLAVGGKPEVTGSFMSFSNSFSRLWGGASSGAGAISAAPQHVWLPLAKHLQRIAGNQVRAAATLGGNLVLTRDIGLESDAATLLIAAGAQVQTASPSAKPAWQSVESFVSATSKAAPGEVVIAIRLPAVKPGDKFWSFKIAERHWNAHAFINIAALVNVSTSDGKDASSAIKSARIVFGYPSAQEGIEHKWQVQRAAAVEKALLGAPASLGSVVAAVKAVSSDVQPGKMLDADFLASTAEGLLFEALVRTLGLEGTKGSKDLPESVLEVPSLHEVEVNHGKQDLPDFSRPGSAAGEPIMKERALLQDLPDFSRPGSAAGKPIMKERVLLQASGEALYSYDIPEEREGLYAAFVGSTEALAVIKGIDASEALKVPGVVAVLDAKDVPGENKSDVEEVFASKKVEWVGQPVGLVVAHSRAVAERAAALVKVDYSRELGPPIVNIQDARKQNSLHKVPALPGPNTNLPAGEKSALPHVEKCPMQIRGAKWHIPTQVHMYMEPQTAVAKWDEGGVIQVTSSTQSADHVQWAVSAALGLPNNRVNVHCRRAGGGFGGKFSRSRPAATAVAVAAYKLRRQVRLQTNRNQDLRMNAGRAETEVEYDIGFDDTGRIHALEIQAYMLGGAYLATSTVDMYQLKGNIDQAYAFPKFHFDLHLCKSNRPPHTAVRGPGEIQATMLAEHLIEHVAARLRMDPMLVRERNFIKHDEAQNGMLRMSLQQEVPSHMFTLPRVWEQMKKDSDFLKRREEVAAFNKKHKWLKRGISMTHCRFRSMVQPRPAVVSIMADGSVMVTTAGMEMGQGMFTKVKQVAVHELSKALPEDQRPLGLEKVEINDNATFWLPNSGGTAGSTAAEGSCEAVRMACQQLVEETLKPKALAMGNNLTWEGMIGDLQPKQPWPSTAKLTAYALYNGTMTDDESGQRKLTYSTFGAACTEVEINLLTGERRVLRSDVLHDAGHSISPAIDMGQVEGGFVFGLGMMLQEHVDYSADGQPLYDSTWDYKIPTAACIPRQFNIALLKDSPNKHGVMGSKSVGEPPLLLSASVMSAFQMAVAAAKEDLARQHQGSAMEDPQGNKVLSYQEQAVQQLCAPVTVKAVKAAVGKLHLAQFLQQYA